MVALFVPPRTSSRPAHRTPGPRPEFLAQAERGGEGGGGGGGDCDDDDDGDMTIGDITYNKVLI